MYKAGGSLDARKEIIALLSEYYCISPSAATVYAQVLRRGSLTQDQTVTKQVIDELIEKDLIYEPVSGTEVYLPKSPIEQLLPQILAKFEQIERIGEYAKHEWERGQRDKVGTILKIIEGQEPVDRAVFNLIRNSPTGSEIKLCVRSLSPLGNSRDSADAIRKRDLSIKVILISEEGTEYFKKAMTRLKELRTHGITKYMLQVKSLPGRQDFRYMIAQDKVVFVTGHRQKGMFAEDAEVAKWFEVIFDSDWNSGRAQTISEGSSTYKGSSIAIRRTKKEFLNANGALIERLASDFQTHSNRPDAQKIGEWLPQFGSPANMEIALKLLRKVLYIDNGKMRDIFKSFFYEELGPQLKQKVVFTVLTKQDESASQVLSICSKGISESDRKKVGWENSLSDVIASRKAEDTIVVFVDDNIGSGTQASRVLTELLDSKITSREYVKTPLSLEQIQWLRRSTLIYFSLIGIDEGELKLEETAKKYGITIASKSAISMEQHIGCFHPKSGIFANERERKRARSLVSKIGYELFADKAMRAVEPWDDEKRKKRSLGFGNLQRLIVFSYSTPTSTLPIFWKEGTYRGRKWTALFPRES